MALAMVQVEFAEYLAGLWSPIHNPRGLPDPQGLPGVEKSYGASAFWHHYEITQHRSWRTWRNGNADGTEFQRLAYAGCRDTRWWGNSLSQAKQHYSWTT